MLKEITIILFILITGINWVCYQISGDQFVTSVDAAFNIFIEVLGTGLTILVLDKLFNAEEKKKWKAVKNDVNILLKEELSAIFIDFAGILIPPVVVSAITPNQIATMTNQHRLRELTNIAEGNITVVENRLRAEQHLLNGEYGNIFRRRYENISDIELKYGKFLEPETLRPMINLERLLKSLQSNINVKLKLAGQTGAFLIPSVEQKIFMRTHDIMKTLNECKTLGLLSLD